MKLIKFKDFRDQVGNSFIVSAVRNFPKRNYKYKTVGNVIYLIGRKEVKLAEIERIKYANPGKPILGCILPMEIASIIK